MFRETPCLLPSSIPTCRFRLRSPVQVRTRSPRARQAGKRCRLSDPAATASRVISASPRVIKAAIVLLPRPSPDTMPAPIAMTFFSAPASSTPVWSVFVYSRRVGPEKADLNGHGQLVHPEKQPRRPPAHPSRSHARRSDPTSRDAGRERAFRLARPRTCARANRFDPFRRADEQHRMDSGRHDEARKTARRCCEGIDQQDDIRVSDTRVPKSSVSSTLSGKRKPGR